MIGLYFNESGYYVQGSRIEEAWSCSPALTESGTPILPPTHHLCGVLYRALRAVQATQTTEDIVVYSDSRLIEEINGAATPLDDTHERWLEIYRRRLLPHIRSHVLFRKKPTEFVRKHVEAGHQKMIGSVDPQVRLEAITREIDRKQKEIEARKARVLERFKEDWNNGHRQEH